MNTWREDLQTFAVDAGDVVIVEILHDHDCPMLSGGACRCQPEIQLRRIDDARMHQSKTTTSPNINDRLKKRKKPMITNEFSNPKNSGLPVLPMLPIVLANQSLRQVHANIFATVEKLHSDLKAADEIADQRKANNQRAMLCRNAKNTLTSLRPAGVSDEAEIVRTACNLAALWADRRAAGVGR